ncbi:MAG: hypothetical protein WCS70_11430 [Verrucomicrobiota bacterium]
MSSTTDFDRLPKFLIADNGGDRFFVIHCHAPRFIMEFVDDQEAVPTWIDAPTGLDAGAAAKLMSAAAEFFAIQIEREG